MEIQFIEPCCAGRQLPSLLREHSIASFQTNGDVTFEHIIKAVSCLAGDVLSVILMVPSVNVDMLRLLAWFGRRGWLKKLHVVTTQNQSDLVSNEISGEVPTVLSSHNARVTDSLLVISGEKKCVVVNGLLLTSVAPGLRFYTAAVGAETSDSIRMFTATLSPLLRNTDTLATPESSADPDSSVNPQSAAPESSVDTDTSITPDTSTAPDTSAVPQSAAPESYVDTDTSIAPGTYVDTDTSTVPDSSTVPDTTAAPQSAAPESSVDTDISVDPDTSVDPDSSAVPQSAALESVAAVDIGGPIPVNPALDISETADQSTVDSPPAHSLNTLASPASDVNATASADNFIASFNKEDSDTLKKRAALSSDKKKRMK